MTVEQFVAVLGALATLIAAMTALLVQARATHALVNSRMTELLELTQKSARAEGALGIIKAPDPVAGVDTIA